jgi:ketosteroid isomerase-like protein
VNRYASSVEDFIAVLTQIEKSLYLSPAPERGAQPICESAMAHSCYRFAGLTRGETRVWQAILRNISARDNVSESEVFPGGDMKRAACIGLLCLITAMSFAQSSANPQEQILGLEREWLKAEANNDSATLNRIFADDFVGVGPGGQLLKKSDIVERPPGAEPPPFSKAKLGETTIEVFGDTAVAFGSLSSLSDGGHQVRFTKVYKLRGGTWKLVAAQLVPVAPQQQ